MDPKFWLLENHFDLCLQKNFLTVCLWETSSIKKKSLFAENFLVRGKFPWSSKTFLWKIIMTVEKFHDCGKLPCL